MSYGHPSNTDAIRQEQLKEGRRLEGTLGIRARSEPTGAPIRREPTMRLPAQQPKRKAPAGHDAVLTHFQSKNIVVRFKLASGSFVEGTIYGKDKFTITVLHSEGRETIYKHAIDSFMEIVATPENVTEH